MPSANFSLTARFETMRRLGDITKERSVGERSSAVSENSTDPTTPSDSFSNRDGYDPDFLSGWNIPLPMPEAAYQMDLQSLRRGGTGPELKYEHFSITMSASRKLPMLTAVNINGAQGRNLPRLNTWSYDGRLDSEDQVGAAVYDNNLLDRGHMVRRQDPVWGETADTANADTFHFTNACPQMAGVNQQTWLGLEDYVLTHAQADKMKVNVYTGPIFKSDDLVYRDVAIPSAFWKVVAIVTDEGRPSVTAYRVSQEKELQDLSYVYGGYKTYQISLRQLMQDTHLDFGALLPYDGFTQQELVANARLEITLESLADIRI